MVGLAADVTEYVIVLNLFASRDKKAVCCFRTLYIFLYEWIIFADKMTFFRLPQEVNSKHMFVMVRVKYVEMQISLSETHERVKTKNKADMIWSQNISYKSHFCFRRTIRRDLKYYKFKTLFKRKHGSVKMLLLMKTAANTMRIRYQCIATVATKFTQQS
jgi:hypothetical protein